MSRWIAPELVKAGENPDRVAGIRQGGDLDAIRSGPPDSDDAHAHSFLNRVKTL
ncbi:hypothetical protein LI99_12340 [Mycolicibacterium smegmatis]|uniref:Uncharacterized protein n=2 Tax=Mycolicibacterium smegmatis (strain ATCC 700084 / mc(2)155) TaxID=246196 RepID=I7G053_MYCS2|nr:hypothetical protein MSMEG_2479 [Mycolicibacterium smegmatis MC2 155]AFP38887.1 hypothetical protein MSMEI_2419 [Mycolicibacterium smegmatis MC2 155]AIU07660.1 hypothetical protein LJ00_12340 [Mycolicibacterium smegmatis MC2 155]AIU14285.1 hypothetical protein LI99_12340 [Mycolicibacterium smegmatis]AIU20908.1 hypothetical protein LI98_12345 [Mycolicibacterium smegmatis]